MEEPTEPVESDRDQRGLRDVANKLDSKVAIVTGASSGIERVMNPRGENADRLLEKEASEDDEAQPRQSGG
jgi:hypothetical protein